jgi:integrase
MSANGNGRGRANGEGSLYPYKNGYAAYVWVTTPTALTWESVNESIPEIGLEWQLVTISGHPLTHNQVLKTDGSTDTLPLPPICLPALKIARQNQAKARTIEWPQKCICGETHTIAFITGNGRPIEPRNLKRSFDKRCAMASVRQIKIHDTRRTCGSLLAALDVHPRIAMQILRHSRIAMTMEIYTQVPDQAARAALNRLSDWLDQADEGAQSG